jgi:hypothetical protein
VVSVSWKGLVSAGAGILVAAGGLEAQERFLTGIVLDDLTLEPLSEAVVELTQQGLRAVTTEDGAFLIEGVPEGPVAVRFEAPGYMSLVEEIELAASDFLQVRLSPVQAVLDEVLVIAGRRPVGLVGSDIHVPEDRESWRSIMDLLEDQVPGVIVRRDGNLGTGASIYLRGVSTITLDNTPDVYLDGVRLDAQNDAGRALHILDMIHADEVEHVRVLKGASAGGGAVMGGANGVILIETHRGRPPSERRR